MKILSFAATWMDLQIIILSEVCQTMKDTHHMISRVWDIKRSTQMKCCVLICRTEIGSQALKTNLWLPKGAVVKGEMGWGFGSGICTLVYGMIGKWGPAVQHRDLYPVFCDGPYGKRS